MANKFKGVYAVRCTCSYEAKKASSVNNANVLVLADGLHPLSMSELINIKAPAGDVDEKRRQLVSALDASSLSDIQIERTAALAAGIEKFMDTNKLDAIAMCCWP